VVVLVAALPTSGDQTRALEDVEVLGDGLPGGAQAVLGGQPGAELEQRLTVPVQQLVEERTPSRVREGLEHIAHCHRIGKHSLA
jgi:hypothetical protein